MAHYQGNRAAIPRVGLIGCGQIGSLWDEQDSSGQTWTHAGAYQQSGLVELVAIADCDQKRLRECAEKRGIARFYQDYGEMLTRESLDILSICTPASERYEIFQLALAQGIRYFFCEKPVASTWADALQLQQLLQRYPDAQVMVNYLRRWEPGLKQVKSILDQGDLGAIQKITALYGKGIINNGTHLIDVLCWYFGEPSQVKRLRAIDDGLQEDITLDVELMFSHLGRQFPVYMLGCDHRQYSVFELDIMAEKGRVYSVNNESIRFLSATENPSFPGYMHLQPSQAIPTDLAHSMLFAVQELVALYLGNTFDVSCHFDDAMRTLKVAHSARSVKPIITQYGYEQTTS